MLAEIVWNSSWHNKSVYFVNQSIVRLTRHLRSSPSVHPTGSHLSRVRTCCRSFRRISSTGEIPTPCTTQHTRHQQCDCKSLINTKHNDNKRHSYKDIYRVLNTSPHTSRLCLTVNSCMLLIIFLTTVQCLMWYSYTSSYYINHGNR